MKKQITTICFLFLNLFSYSQSYLSEEQVTEYMQIAQDLEGTFQIQMIDTRATPALTLDVFPQLLELRDETEVRYLNINPTMRIMILPRSVVESLNFQEIDRMVRINSSDL